MNVYQNYKNLKFKYLWNLLYGWKQTQIGNFGGEFYNIMADIWQLLFY